MAKPQGRAALRVSDVAAPIDVVRDGLPADGSRSRVPHSHAPHDDDERLMHQVSDDMRAALVPERIAEAVARQLHAAVAQRVRTLLRQHLARELRALLSKHATNGFVDMEPADVLNDSLADPLAEGTAEVLAEQFPAALSERLPVAIRAATASGTSAHNGGGAGVEHFADRIGAMAESTIRQRLGALLRSVVRARLAEVARDDARELLRIGSSPEDSGMSSADRVASLAEAIERAAHDRVVRGVVERFRVLVAAGLNHATGERLGDGLRRTRAPAAAIDPIAPARRAKAAENAPQKAPQEAPHPRIKADGLSGRIEGPLAESIRTQIMDGLHERVEATCRENIDEVLRERLSGAIRVAVAEQREAEDVDVARLGEVINYELAEVLRARICDGIRARTAEAVRTRLGDAIRAGIEHASSV